LEPDLIVERTDIHFRSIAPGRVRISVNVTNVGFARSEPTTMHLQAAPLGAFVPWSDLTSLVVPPIEPGRSVEVTADVAAPPVESLGEFSRVPPRRLLTAIGGEDGPHRQTPEAPPKHAQPKHASPRKGQPRHKQPTHQQAATSWWQLLTRFFGRKKPVQTSITLPPDPHDLLARPNIHWAGNINVLIGRT